MHPYDFNTAYNCHNFVLYVGFCSVNSKLNFHKRKLNPKYVLTALLII